MKLPRFFTRRNPAAELARIGHEKRRQSVREKTQQIRRELGLGEHPALTNSRKAHV